jgi:hypothetical protein
MIDSIHQLIMVPLRHLDVSAVSLSSASAGSRTMRTRVAPWTWRCTNTHAQAAADAPDFPSTSALARPGHYPQTRKRGRKASRVLRSATLADMLVIHQSASDAVILWPR